jgi:DNA-binding protein YbaB
VEPLEKPMQPPYAEELGEHMESMTELFNGMVGQLSRIAVSASDGSGAVLVHMTAGGSVQVRIDPAVVNPNDTAMLEHLVHAALSNASAELQREAADAWTDRMGPDQ